VLIGILDLMYGDASRKIGMRGGEGAGAATLRDDTAMRAPLLLIATLTLAGCTGRATTPASPAAAAPAPDTAAVAAAAEAPLFTAEFPQDGAVPVPERADEPRLRNVRRLTHRGENAEAYFSADGRRLVFQSTGPGVPCDQIFTMALDGTDVQRVSTGLGRTTCAYFYQNDRRILFSSTHETMGPGCPAPPDFAHGYVWALHPYDIYTVAADGSELRRLTHRPDSYDAEATLSPAGDRIVFTSTRDGNIDIYTMNVDGSDVRRLTHQEGYHGGPFYSPDGTRIVYRAHHPASDEERELFRRRLAAGVVGATSLEIWTMAADGSDKRQVTANGRANFAPFFHPDGQRIIFSSNMGDPRGRNFDLYLIATDGTGLERVTSDPTFDGFPMFSPDGRHLVFASNRASREAGETNVYIADWVERPETGAAAPAPVRGAGR
jgi:TolB protein